MSATTQEAGGNNAEDFITDFAMKKAAQKARQLAVRPEFGDCDAEDIKQELLMYLIQKVDSFDPSRAKRNTFIDRVIESGASELARNRARHKRHPSDDEGYIPSFSKPIDTVDESFATLGDELDAVDQARRLCNTVSDPFDEVDRRLDVETAMDAMPDEMRAIATYMMLHNNMQTCEKFGLKRRAFDKVRSEIRKHLQRFDVL